MLSQASIIRAIQAKLFLGALSQRVNSNMSSFLIGQRQALCARSYYAVFRLQKFLVFATSL